MEKISSSRTNTTKLLSLILAIVMSAFSIILLFLAKGDSQPIFFAIGLIVFSIPCIILSLKLTTMTVDNDNVIFSNLFKKKKTVVPLDDIKPYLIKSFKLGAGSFAKYSTVIYKDTQGRYIKFLVLSPSGFSSNSDIPKSIESLQRELKHVSIMNKKSQYPHK